MTGSDVAPSLGMITGVNWPIRLAPEQSDVAPSNHRTLETAWRVHVQPGPGRTRLADVDLNGVERRAATMGKDSGATVVIRAYGVRAERLDDAAKSRRLANNPARGVEKLPRKSARRDAYLSPEDAGRLAGESGQHRTLVSCCVLRDQVAKLSRSGCAMSSSYAGGEACTTTPSSSEWIKRSARPRAATTAPCRHRNSCR